MQRPGRITLRPSMLHETHFLLFFTQKLFSVALRSQDVSNSRDRTFQSDAKHLTAITYKFLHTSTLSLNYFGAMAIVVDRPNFIQVTQVRFHIPMCLHHKKENLYLCFVHLLPKPYTYFDVRLINGVARIFSYLLCRDQVSNSHQFNGTSLEGP